MWAVRNCGCDEILDRDPSKYDSNRHYFTCHHSTFDLKETDDTSSVVANPPTPTEIKDEIIPSSLPKVDLAPQFDGCVTKVLDGETENVEVINSGFAPQSIEKDLNTTFDDWMIKVLDDEAVRSRTTADLTKKINDSLSRQLQDGLLSYYEYIDLEYIARLWMRLLNSIHRYHLGCGCNKRDILSILLELFESKQITRSLFIGSVLQLGEGRKLHNSVKSH